MRKLTLLLSFLMITGVSATYAHKGCCKKGEKCAKEAKCCKDKKHCAKECKKDEAKKAETKS